MRRIVAALLTIGLPIWICGAAAQPVPPNILLVIADDMGLDASPCYAVGGEKPAMPVLEAMCADGLVFDNVWAQPVCSPTRATILTGRYGFRTGVLKPSRLNGDGGIRPDELSLHRLLDEAAPTPYAHAVIGKWHLSDADNGGIDNPELMGVGFYSGFISGALPDYYRFTLTTNGRQSEATTYATTLFTDIAIDWIAGQTSPWFLWLAHTAPHTPFHVPPPGLHARDLDGDPVAVRANPRPYYLAALEALDHELGRLLAALDTKTRANTVIIFIGDNGTPSRVVQPPYSRQTAKGSLYPGGIHVPMVIAGKGVERRGERESALVDTTDLFATIANLAGVARAPGSDSVSFVSLLAGTRSSGRNFAYADLDADQPKMMARNSGWTVRDATHQFVSLKSGKRLLFDLSADPGGEDDLLKHGNAVALDTAGRLETLGRTLRESR